MKPNLKYVEKDGIRFGYTDDEAYQFNHLIYSKSPTSIYCSPKGVYFYRHACPINSAIMNGDYDAVKKELDYAKTVKSSRVPNVALATSTFGIERSLLEIACSYKPSIKSGIPELLLDYGADPNFTTGFPPLHNLLTSEMPESLGAMKRLIEAGADVNSWNDNGRTAIFQAVIDENLPAITLLMKHEADPSIKSRKGNFPINTSALELAKQCFPVAVEILIKEPVEEHENASICRM